MKRVHLAVAATILLFCTLLTTLLPAGWSGVPRGLFVGQADAFSKEQRKILKGMGSLKKMKKRKMQGKRKGKGKRKGMGKGKKKNWD